MRRSLVVRSAVLYLALIISNITVVIVMVFENQIDLIARNATVHSQLIGLRFAEAFTTVSPTTPDRELLESFDVESFILFDERGRTIAAPYVRASAPEPPSIEARYAGIHAALTGRAFQNRLFHHVLDYPSRRLDLYIPVDDDGTERLVALARIRLTGIDRELTYLYRQAAILGGLALFLHALFAWYLARRILNPLSHIVAATEAVARGDLSVRLPVSDDTEMGRLSTAFNEMSSAVAHMHHEARAANPLTGLPGNPAIVAEIESHLHEGATPIAILYVDLDHFKTFNDRYGFSRGDEAIIFTRDAIKREAELIPGTFVGHQGGDDFVVVTPDEHGEELADRIIARFEREKSRVVDAEDLRRGWIAGRDRNGVERRFPLPAVSIGIVSTARRTFVHHGEVAAVAAEVKHVAKQVEGSSRAGDRRTDTVVAEHTT